MGFGTKKSKIVRKIFSSESQKAHDMFRGEETVVSLRPRRMHIEFSLAALHRAYQKNRTAFLGVSALAILLVAFGIYHSVTLAGSATLYPSSCLGGWDNPQNAEGKPDVDSGSDASAFTEDNSAVLPANTSSDIFCGGFTGSMPQDAQPIKIVLTFSWAEVAEATSSVAVPDDSLAPIIIATSTPTDDTLAPTDATDTGDTNSVTPDASAPAPDASPVVPDPTAPADTNSNTGADAPAAPIDDSSDSSPVSLLDFFTPKAYADDSTTTVPISDTSNNPGDGFLEVDYTLDGNTWQTLGTIDAAELSTASFDIPIPQGAHWADVSNLQVSIKSISSLDPTPAVYLDSMLLTTDYQNVSRLSISATSTPLMNESAFSTDRESTALVQPQFIDGSSNIIFYRDDGSGNSQYVADTNDTLYASDPSFADYPGTSEDVTPGTYVAVEYINDNQQFSCASLSLDGCIADPHFLRKFSFMLASSTEDSSDDASMSE